MAEERRYKALARLIVTDKVVREGRGSTPWIIEPDEEFDHEDFPEGEWNGMSRDERLAFAVSVKLVKLIKGTLSLSGMSVSEVKKNVEEGVISPSDALEAETASGSPRSTLVPWLEDKKAAHQAGDWSPGPSATEGVATPVSATTTSNTVSVADTTPAV